MRTNPSLAVAAALLALAPSARALAAEAKSPEQERDARLCKLLDEARKGKPALADVRLEAMGPGAQASRSLLLFGDGVGVWKGARQFRVDVKAVRDLLTTVDKAGFCTWPSQASRVGSKNAKEVEVDPDGVQMDRAISLTIGDVSKTVAHVVNSPDSAPFDALLKKLLDACEPAGEKGVAAGSLQDGLAKVRDGALAPEVLEVSLNSVQQSAADPEGWLLRLHGLTLQTERNTKAAGYTDRKRMRLSEQEARDLAKLLLDVNFVGLPGNVAAAGYTDLRVTVLDRTQAIQARAFAGAGPGSKPEAQEAFAKVRQALHDLYARAAGGDKPASAS